MKRRTLDLEKCAASGLAIGVVVGIVLIVVYGILVELGIFP